MSVDNKKDGNIVNTAVNLARDSVQSFKDSAEGFMKGIRS